MSISPGPGFKASPDLATMVCDATLTRQPPVCISYTITDHIIVSIAGQLHREYKHAQLRGLPYPILWVAETFTIDYGQVRIGRYYRQSGWFAHVFLWYGMTGKLIGSRLTFAPIDRLSIPLFVLANVLFQMVIQYGSLFMIFTGMSLLVANLLMTVMRSTIPFQLAFQDLNSDFSSQFLTLHFSWCYYVNLINGE